MTIAVVTLAFDDANAAAVASFVNAIPGLMTVGPPPPPGAVTVTVTVTITTDDIPPTPSSTGQKSSLTVYGPESRLNSLFSLLDQSNTPYEKTALAYTTGIAPSPPQLPEASMRWAVYVAWAVTLCCIAAWGYARDTARRRT